MSSYRLILCHYMLFSIFFLMIRRPPRSTRTDTLFPYTTLFRSEVGLQGVDQLVGALVEHPPQACDLRLAPRRWTGATGVEGGPQLLHHLGSVELGGGRGGGVGRHASSLAAHPPPGNVRPKCAVRAGCREYPAPPPARALRPDAPTRRRAAGARRSRSRRAIVWT